METLLNATVPAHTDDLSRKIAYLDNVIEYCETSFLSSPSPGETLDQAVSYVQDALGVIVQSVLDSAQAVTDLVDAEADALKEVCQDSELVLARLRAVRQRARSVLEPPPADAEDDVAGPKTAPARLDEMRRGSRPYRYLYYREGVGKLFWRKMDVPYMVEVGLLDDGRPRQICIQPPEGVMGPDGALYL